MSFQEENNKLLSVALTLCSYTVVLGISSLFFFFFLWGGDWCQDHLSLKRESTISAPRCKIFLEVVSAGNLLVKCIHEGVSKTPSNICCSSQFLYVRCRDVQSCCLHFQSTLFFEGVFNQSQ